MKNKIPSWCYVFILACLAVPVLSIESFIVWCISLFICYKCIKISKDTDKPLKKRLTLCTLWTVINISSGILFNIAVYKITNLVISLI